MGPIVGRGFFLGGMSVQASIAPLYLFSRIGFVLVIICGTNCWLVFFKVVCRPSKQGCSSCSRYLYRIGLLNCGTNYGLEPFFFWWYVVQAGKRGCPYCSRFLLQNRWTFTLRISKNFYRLPLCIYVSLYRG